MQCMLIFGPYSVHGKTKLPRTRTRIRSESRLSDSLPQNLTDRRFPGPVGLLKTRDGVFREVLYLSSFNGQGSRRSGFCFLAANTGSWIQGTD